MVKLTLSTIVLAATAAILSIATTPTSAAPARFSLVVDNDAFRAAMALNRLQRDHNGCCSAQGYCGQGPNYCTPGK
ncbi:hypothetical protein DFS34DRAFT_646992 [Phlyctochytrium arcticum]|nr:hypothetical protein DFS34DRAFT_646992 [Phlyctochytrium arcticum]